MSHGKPITKKSNRPTDRAPHMGKYVRIGHRFGVYGVHVVIDNQAFFQPVVLDDKLTPAERRAHVQWHRDMLCIALDNLVEIERSNRTE